MIKVEVGTGTVVREGETIPVFSGMVIYEEELASLQGDLVYSIDELEIIYVNTDSKAGESSEKDS